MAEDGTQQIKETSIQLGSLGIQLGVIENLQRKWTIAIQNTPIIKQAIQLRRFAGGLKQSTMARNDDNEALGESIEQYGDMQTIMTGAIAGVIKFSKSTDKLTKITGFLNTNFVAIASSMLFFFGIIALVMIAVLGLIAVFADVDSPLVQWIDNTVILGDMLNGLRIILTGEDGESGLKGAIDVLLVSAVLFIAVALVFGSTIAFIVGGLVLAVGVFNWVKGKTDSLAAAWASAIAVLVGVLAIFVQFKAVTTAIKAGTKIVWSGTATVLAGIALVIAGVAGLVAFATGAGSGIKAVLLAIGTAFLIFIGIILIGIGWPVAAVIAVGALIVAVVFRYRDEILDILKMLGSKVRDGWNAAEAFFNSARNFVRNLILGIVKIIVSPFVFLFELGKKIGTKLMAGLEFISSIGTRFTNRIKKTLGGIKNTIINGIKGIINRGWIEPINAGLRVLNSLSIKIPKWARKGPLEGISEISLGIPLLTPFAKGGIVTGPTAALIGEAGPEAVIPLDEAGGMGNTFNINIDVSGITATSDHAKRELADEISRRIMSDISDRIGSPTYGRF